MSRQTNATTPEPGREQDTCAVVQSVAPLEQVCITCSDAVAPLRCGPLAFFHVNTNMLYITEELKVNYYSMHIIYYSWVYTASLDSLKELGFISIH